MLLAEAAPLPVIIRNSQWYTCTCRTPKFIRRENKAHMIDVGHTAECTASSHSGTVKVKIVSELTGLGNWQSRQKEIYSQSPDNHHESTVLPKKKHCVCRIWWKSVNHRLICLDWAFRVLQGSCLFLFWKAFVTALLRLMWQAFWKICFISARQVPFSCVVLEVRAETFASQGDPGIWAENYVLIYWKYERERLHFTASVSFNNQVSNEYQ